MRRATEGQCPVVDRLRVADVVTNRLIGDAVVASHFPSRGRQRARRERIEEGIGLMRPDRVDGLALSEVLDEIPDRHQVIRVAPTPLEYWIATTDNNDNKLLREYQERYPEASKWEVLCKLAEDYPRGNRNAQ